MGGAARQRAVVKDNPGVSELNNQKNSSIGEIGRPGEEYICGGKIGCLVWNVIDRNVC